MNKQAPQKGTKNKSKPYSVMAKRSFSNFDRELDLEIAVAWRSGPILRLPADVHALAHRGGLAGPSMPYEGGLRNDKLFLSVSGNGTTTVSGHELIGLANAAEDAREFCLQFSDDRLTPHVIRESIPTVGWVPDQWIQSNILDGRLQQNHLETGAQMFKEPCDEVPKIRRLPDLRASAKKGEVGGQRRSWFHSEIAPRMGSMPPHRSYRQ
jgi:hypothetical protein